MMLISSIYVYAPPTNLFHSVVYNGQWPAFSSIQFLWTTEHILLKPPMHATCLAKPFLLSLLTLTLFGEHYILLCSVVHYQP
jgi:hypothetical protein